MLTEVFIQKLGRWKNAIKTTENPEEATMDVNFDECLCKEVRRCLHLYNLSLKKYKDVFFVL